MAGRKAVMVDTETWNRLEKYRHNAYIRAIGDAVTDLLTVNNSYKYYVGLKHTTENKLIACSFGRTDEEAVRNLLKKFDDLTMGDIRSEEDIVDGEECYFTIECTNRLYELRGYVDGITAFAYPPCCRFDLAESLSNLIIIEIIKDTVIADYATGGIFEIPHKADIRDSYYALIRDEYVFCVSPTIEGLVDAVWKIYNNTFLEYPDKVHACFIDTQYESEYDDDEHSPAFNEAYYELDSRIESLDALFEGCEIQRCSKNLYKEAVALGHGPHEFSLKKDLEWRWGDDTENEGEEYLVSEYESVPRDDVTGLFGCCAFNKEDSKLYLVSCGMTCMEALKNLKLVKLPDGLEIINDINLTLVECTKELFTAFIMSNYYDKKEGNPVECHLSEELGSTLLLLDLGPDPETKETK